MKHILLALLVLTAAVQSAAARVILIPLFLPQPRLTEPKIPDYSGIHTVAVISTLGGTLRMSTNHFWLADDKDLDIRSLGIDDEIKARLKQYLSPRFVFKDVPFDPARLVPEPSALIEHPDNISSFIQTLPKDAVDAYIIVRPAKITNQAPGFNGLALMNGGDFGADAKPVVWANFQIVLVDAQTSQILTKAYSRVRFRDNEPPSFPGTIAPDALKLTKGTDLTPALMPVLHETISYLLRVSIVETLRSLQLGDALPAPGARTLVPIPPDKNPYGSYKTVAVASVLGDDFQFDHMGGTIFSESNFRAAKPQWHIDQQVEKRAEDALAKHFSIVHPDIDRQALSRATIWDDDGKLTPDFPGVPAGTGADLYVLFLNLNERMLGMHFTKGLGVFNRTPVTAEPNTTTIFAHFAVVAIDGKTMKLVAAQSGIMSPARATVEPREDIGANFWPKSPPVTTEEQDAGLHQALNDVLDDSVDETLLKLELLGVFPAEDAPTTGQTQQ